MALQVTKRSNRVLNVSTLLVIRVFIIVCMMLHPRNLLDQTNPPDSFTSQPQAITKPIVTPPFAELSSSSFGGSKAMNQPYNARCERKSPVPGDLKNVHQISSFGAPQNIAQYTASPFGAPECTKQLHAEQTPAENTPFAFGGPRNMHQGPSLGTPQNLVETTVSAFGAPKWKRQWYERTFESTPVALENPKSIHRVSPFSAPACMPQLSTFGAPKPLSDFACVTGLERPSSPRFESHPFATSPRFASRPSFSDDRCSDKSDDDSGESYDWSIKSNYRNSGSWPSNSLPRRALKATEIKAEKRNYQAPLFTRPPTHSKKPESSLSSELFNLKSCTIHFEGLSAKSKLATPKKRSFENYPDHPGDRDPDDINELYTARHREKHGEATEHMRKLYDLLQNDWSLRSLEAQKAKKELDRIDGRILDINSGDGLFLGLGQIRRETFISIWRSIITPPGGWPRHFTKTQISDLHSQAKLALKEFCEEYDYPSKWACLPPC